jgi:putative addiction module component (TIGR02574 family)
MPLTLEQLAEEALHLPPECRASLSDRIVESLDFSEPDDIQKVWAAESVRRRDEIRSGKTKAIPGQDVIEEVRRIVGR